MKTACRFPLLFVCAACSVVPVDTLIRSPVDSKCQSYGLKGCPEIVEGAVAYAGGDKPGAMVKLNEARAKNTPEQLAKFAEALREVANTTDAAKPLAEVASILTTPLESVPAAAETQGSASVKATPEQPPASHSASVATQSEHSGDRRSIAERLALYALTAREDPARRFAETVEVSDAPGVPCQVAGSPALCLRRKQGPMTVTDAVAAEECGTRVFLSAADSDTPAFGLLWTLPTRPGVHGATFSLKGGQWLFVAVKPPAKPQATDRNCFLTWSGFQPRLVPALTSDGSEDYTASP